MCQTRADGLGLQAEVVKGDAFEFGKDVCGVLVQYPDTHGTVSDYKASAGQRCCYAGRSSCGVGAAMQGAAVAGWSGWTSAGAGAAVLALPVGSSRQLLGATAGQRPAAQNTVFTACLCGPDTQHTDDIVPVFLA